MQSLYILPGTVNDAYFLPSPHGLDVALARVIHGSITDPKRKRELGSELPSLAIRVRKAQIDPPLPCRE